MFNKIFHSFQLTKELHETGQLHKKIKIRLYMMAVMVLIGFGIIVYDIVVGRISFIMALIYILITAILGLLMSKTNKMDWDEETELLVAGKMDWTSGIILAIYMLVRLGSRVYLNNFYHNAVTVLAISMAIMAGFALGNFIGLTLTVRRTYLNKDIEIK